MRERETKKVTVTGSCPFGDCSRQFVYRAKNVRSTNSCQVQAFQEILRTYIG